MTEILPQLIANSLIAASIYALLALGFNLIYGTVKFFDFTYGSYAITGGYSVFFLYKKLGWSLPLSVVSGVAAAALVAVLMYWLVYRPLVRRKASSMILLVASIGMFTAWQALIAILFTSQFQTLTTGAGSRIYDIAGGIVTQVQGVIFFSAILILAALSLMLLFSKFGKAIRAVSDDREVAAIIGIPTERVTVGVFAIGGAIAGLAGILIGFDTGLEPTMGMALLLKGVVAAIIGGVGNMLGAVAGATLLGFAENFGVWVISGEWKDAIAFALLIIFLLFRPQGIFRR